MHERCLYNQIQTFKTFHFLNGFTVAIYADDATPYSAKKNRFSNNGLTLTTWKSIVTKIVYFSQEMTFVSVTIDNNTVISENKNELLHQPCSQSNSPSSYSEKMRWGRGWLLDSFGLIKASQKLNALARIAPHMYLEKNRYESISNIRIRIQSISLDVL